MVAWVRRGVRRAPVLACEPRKKEVKAAPPRCAAARETCDICGVRMFLEEKKSIGDVVYGLNIINLDFPRKVLLILRSCARINVTFKYLCYTTLFTGAIYVTFDENQTFFCREWKSRSSELPPNIQPLGMFVDRGHDNGRYVIKSGSRCTLGTSSFRSCEKSTTCSPGSSSPFPV
jgi:hypothetical protein